MTKQSIETTKANLANMLKDCGLTKTDHTNGQKAQTWLKGAANTNKTLDSWVTIGGICAKSKEHFASTKTNLNSGLFGDYCKTYFSKISAQEISVSQWLYKNHIEVKAFNKTQKVASNNPEVIRRNIRKALKEDKKATKETYEKFGLKEPKEKVQSTTVDKSVQENEKVLNRQALHNAPTAALFGWIEAIALNLTERARKNKGAFSGADLLDLQKIQIQLADLELAITVNKDKAKNRNIQASASK